MLASDLDEVFENEDIGKDAQYTPVGGTAVDIRVIPKGPDVVTSIEGSRIVSTTQVFDARVSEIANPKDGDQLVYAGTTYKIQGKPMRNDRLRLIWTLNTVPA